MTNLLPESASEIAEKIDLYNNFDPSNYPLENQEALESFKSACVADLETKLAAINGKLSAVNKSEVGSLPLATEKNAEDAFVMQPEDPSEYMVNGLSFPYTHTDHMLDDVMTYGDSVIETDDGGNTIIIRLSQITENDDQLRAWPFRSVQVDLTIWFNWAANGRYDADHAEFIITYTDLYRGPLDEIDDRGANYYDKIVATATYSEPIIGNPTTRYSRVGSTWSLNVSSAPNDAYTLDNGSAGTIDFGFNFTTTSSLNKFVGGEIVDSNGTNSSLNGYISMPKFQWSEFTKTQSPNILNKINDFSSDAEPIETDMYIIDLESQLNTIWDETIDALPNGEYIRKEEVIENVITAIKANKSFDPIIVGKKYLGEETFYQSASIAINNLGIEGIITIDTDLAEINEKLIEVGITNFEVGVGYYNWVNVPECNSLDVCSQYASAVFDRVDSLDTVLENPGSKWLSDNFKYIELDINETNKALEEII